MTPEEHLNQVSMSFYKIKNNVDQVGFTTPKIVNELIGSCMEYVLWINKLEKQLEHALLTGGELLKIEEKLH